MTEELKLHLGCGKRHLPGWIGVDSRDDVGADVVCDVRDLGAWASGEVAAIYACHVLEHIPRPQVLFTLREWRRVLRPGGKLYVAVPDFQAITILYLHDSVPLWRIVGPVCGRQDYEANTHYSIYDYQYLAWTLTEAGFHSIKKQNCFCWLPDAWDDYSRAKIDDISISLNVEATKGGATDDVTMREVLEKARKLREQIWGVETTTGPTTFNLDAMADTGQPTAIADWLKTGFPDCSFTVEVRDDCGA